MWVVVVVVAVIAAVAGFFIGRRGGNEKARIEELETEVSRQKEELTTYKQEVEAHFDKSASLFVSMAGSYKSLFEHLSTGYEKLSEGSARELFKERVTALLLDGPKKTEDGSPSDQEAQAKSADDPIGAASPADTTTTASVSGDTSAPGEQESVKAAEGVASSAEKPATDAAQDTQPGEPPVTASTGPTGAGATDAAAEAPAVGSEQKQPVPADPAPDQDIRAETQSGEGAQPADKEESTLEKAVRKNAESQREAAEHASAESGAAASSEKAGEPQSPGKS